MWNESLKSQLKWKFHKDLMDIVKPSMQDFRDISIVTELDDQEEGEYNAR